MSRLRPDNCAADAGAGRPRRLPFPPNIETNIFLSEQGPAGSAFKVSGEGFPGGETVIITMSATETVDDGQPGWELQWRRGDGPVKVRYLAPNRSTSPRAATRIRFATAPFTVMAD
jgi:hypothetical protein